jgi:hypothetical protein
MFSHGAPARPTSPGGHGKGAVAKTTVDVYIRKADGSDSFSLHSGLFGAASTALHTLIRAFEDGAISGPWHSSYIDTTVKGAIVRSILAGISELDPPCHQPGDWARLTAFQQAIDDDGDYTVKAIEC